MAFKKSASRVVSIPYVGEDAVRCCVAAARRVGKVRSLRTKLRHLDVYVRGSLWPPRNAADLSISIDALSTTSSRLDITSTSNDGMIGFGSAASAIDVYLD